MRPALVITSEIDLIRDEGETIAAVGEPIEAPDAEVVDFSGRALIPGLVNAHLHTWQTSLRSVGADWTLMEYLTHLHGECSGHHTPADMHISNLAGALNQLNCGTTTLGDRCHHALSPEHADAAVEGLVQAASAPSSCTAHPAARHSLSSAACRSEAMVLGSMTMLMSGRLAGRRPAGFKGPASRQR